MSEVYTNQEKLSGQVADKYDDSTKIYDQSDMQYNGKTRTGYSNQTKN